MAPRRSPLDHALHGPANEDGADDSSTVQKGTTPGRASGVSAGGSTQGTGQAVVDTTRPGKSMFGQQSVFKQEVDRRATTSPQVSRSVRANGGVTKPYDPALLRDVADSGPAQAYIDTLAQDVASARWSLVARDEDTDLEDEDRAELERKLESIHPEKSFRDILEQTARNLLELGDAAWVKHYFENSDELAEVVPVDSARIFKRVDNHGLTQAYLQTEFSTLDIGDTLDTSEVVWFEWASRTDHVYGHGPVEKGLETLMLLDELQQKEKKDLEEGMPPGIVSAAEDADNPLPPDEFDTVKEEFELHEGERHRLLVTRGEWDFTDFSGNYQELQILDRNKFWIHVLGAVMKVNPPYAGFDFQEGNKAQNESQKEAYAQRGFRQTLRQVEEAITRQLIHEDLTEELDFKFEREQTVAERKEQATLLEQAANAAEAWAGAGRNVTVDEDGNLTVEPGEVTPDDVDKPDSGGPLFGSVDKEGVQKAVPLSAPAGNNPVGDDAMGEWRKFLADIADEGGMVMDPESERTYPGDELAPTGNVVVFGVEPERLRSLMEAYPGVQYNVEEPTSRDPPGGDEFEDSEAESPADGTPPGMDLTEDEVLRMDEILEGAYKSQIWPESVDDIEKRAWSGDQSVPDYVLEQISMAIDRGAVFDDFETLPERVVEEVKSLLKDNLTQPQGWSLDSVVDDFKDVFPGVPEEQLETVARTETASVLNTAREEGYQSREESGRFKFKWVGPSDNRTTDACTELKERTNPDHGGTPVSLPDLKRMEQEVHAEHFENLEFRTHTIHPNERHTFVRVVEDPLAESGEGGDLT